MNQSWTTYGSWLLMAVLVVLAWAWLRRSALAQETTPEELRVRLQSGARVVDVRTPEEFAQGHVPGALNVPLDRIRSQAPTLFPDKQQSLLLYCRSGRRSGLALEELRQLGYTNVWNLGGLSRAQQLISAARETPPARQHPATGASASHARSSSSGHPAPAPHQPPR